MLQNILRALRMFKLTQAQSTVPYSYDNYSGKVWRIDSFRAFGEIKFGELIDQPIRY